MKRSVLWISLLMAGLAFMVSADENPAPFRPGETITYAIEQFRVKAGTATLTYHGLQRLPDGRDAVLIVFKADGLNFFDEEVIYVDPQNFYPLLVKRNLDIFGKKEKIIEEYLPQQKKIKLTKTAGNKTSVDFLETKGTVDNIYGFIYRYRQTGEFKLGEQFLMRLPTKKIKLKLDKEMKLKAAGQEFDAYYVHSEPAKYKFWFDKSERRLPLRIVGSAGLANTNMIMTSYKF